MRAESTDHWLLLGLWALPTTFFWSFSILYIAPGIFIEHSIYSTSQSPRGGVWGALYHGTISAKCVRDRSIITLIHRSPATWNTSAAWLGSVDASHWTICRYPPKLFSAILGPLTWGNSVWDARYLDFSKPTTAWSVVDCSLYLPISMVWQVPSQSYKLHRFLPSYSIYSLTNFEVITVISCMNPVFAQLTSQHNLRSKERERSNPIRRFHVELSWLRHPKRPSLIIYLSGTWPHRYLDSVHITTMDIEEQVRMQSESN